MLSSVCACSICSRRLSKKSTKQRKKKLSLVKRNSFEERAHTQSIFTPSFDSIFVYPPRRLLETNNGRNDTPLQMENVSAAVRRAVVGAVIGGSRRPRGGNLKHESALGELVVGGLDLLISVCESEAPNGRSVEAGRNNAPVKRFANARGKFKISSHSALSAVGSKRKQASISSSSRNTDVDYVLFKEVMKNKKAKQECEQSRRDAIKVGLDKLKELTREFVDSAHRVSRRGPTEKQTLKIVLVRLRLAKGLPPFPPNLLIEDSNFRAMPASFITPGCRVTENGFQIPKGGFAKDKRGVQRMENKQRGERRRRNVQRLENELVKMCVPENMQASLNKKGILNCIAHSMTVLPPPKPSERLRIQAIIKKSNVVIPKHMGQPIPLLDEKNRASPAIATENILQAFYDF